MVPKGNTLAFRSKQYRNGGQPGCRVHWNTFALMLGYHRTSKVVGTRTSLFGPLESKSNCRLGSHCSRLFVTLKGYSEQQVSPIVRGRLSSFKSRTCLATWSGAMFGGTRADGD